MFKLTALLGLALLAGCFHGTVETGAPASNEMIRKDWASGWIAGLVPPKTVETAGRCKNGVSKIEMQQTFGNQLVSLLTLSIYTPMSIRVTCAAPPQ